MTSHTRRTANRDTGVVMVLCSKGRSGDPRPLEPAVALAHTVGA